jgi:hypothetical protein
MTMTKSVDVLMWRNVLFVGKKKCVNITSGLDSFRWKIEIDLKATIVQSFICLLKSRYQSRFQFFRAGSEELSRLVALSPKFISLLADAGR